MIGGSSISEHAIGEFIDSMPAPLVLEPHSRIASGTFQPPASVPTVLEGVNWDDGTIMLWDDETVILWDT